VKYLTGRKGCVATRLQIFEEIDRPREKADWQVCTWLPYCRVLLLYIVPHHNSATSASGGGLWDEHLGALLGFMHGPYSENLVITGSGLSRTDIDSEKRKDSPDGGRKKTSL